MEVAREAYPDHFAFDESSEYYDERSTADKPRWHMVGGPGPGHARALWQGVRSSSACWPV